MQNIEQWIWLPKEDYNDNQTTIHSGFLAKNVKYYTVAEFVKNYSFKKNIVKANLRFSGDTSFQLYCNDNIVATGPACVGGDFIGNETPRDNFYSYETSICPNSNQLNIFARVQMMPIQICEYSKGHGGFMLFATLFFEDGTQEIISTDETWLVRKNSSYNAPMSFDGRIKPDEYVNAEYTPNIWNTTTAPIPVREEHEICEKDGKISLLPHEEKILVLDFDKIWSGFVCVYVKTQGNLFASLMCRELEETTKAESLVFSGEQEYRSFYMHSAGNILLELKNDSNFVSDIKVSFIATYYPVYEEVSTVTSDAQLNLVLQTCKHTLKICRQTHHLDSPRHCEPLACTGDYYIETLMTPFSFGNMRLAEFDLIRTAVMLERENGRMFHTTYSLIWVKMLYDVYMFTGNKDLLKKCEKALNLLLERFESYVGENGLIENPPDYMFIDWMFVDGISMHHPPKALGQSCLNMFYFGALDSAEKIYAVLGLTKFAENCLKKKENLRITINSLLFDYKKGCYFEGLTTPTKDELINKWMPQNVEKRYYLKHSNILAAYFGVCSDEIGKVLIDKIMTNKIEGNCQPYFIHYLLDAVYRLGLREQYTLKICEQWKEPVEECSKGLVEGFAVPGLVYHFDHSHAWGGSPLYSLPKALLGLDIVSPGMNKIILSPNLLGLEYAKVELLTPHGKVVCEMNEDCETKITHPKDVVVVFR